MKKFITLLFLFLVSIHLIKAQDKVNKKEWTHVIGIGYLNTSIKNENINDDEALKTVNKSNIFAEFNLLYPISTSVFFVTGINYLSYSNVSKSEGIFKAFSLKRDIDGFDYYPTVETNFSEQRVISFLSLPLGIRKVFLPEKNASAFFELGLTTNYTIKSRVTETGSYHKKGLYLDSRYSNVYHLLEDVPRLGYIEVLKNETNQISVSRVNFNYFLSLGFLVAANDKTKLSFKGFYNSSILDITNQDDKNKDYLKVTGIKDTYKKNTVSSLGLIVEVVF
jgi:hypothetical protein